MAITGLGVVPVRALVIDDSDDDALLIVSHLRRGGITLAYERVETIQELAESLAARPPDIVLCDYNLPGFSAQDALRMLQDSGLDASFILVSGAVGEETAAAIMKAGAHDFILKDRLSRLVPAVERELRDAQARRQQHGAEAALRDSEERFDRERERMDRELRQADRLDSLGRLAGGIAHDFNNVLAVIMAYAGELTSSLPDGHSAKPDALKIVQAAEHAAALTRQLLIFSRLAPSQQETLNLASVITDIEQLLRRTIGEDIEFLTLIQPDLYPVTIDRTKLEQVIMNLVMNSRGAMPHGGRLCIEAANIDQGGGAPSGSGGERKLVSLTVTDTGSGMTPEVAQHAFEPFFTTKGPGQGTGLGLSTVYGVVKEAGGDIRLQSQPGSSTTITVRLPAADQEINRAQVTRPAAAGGLGRVILVVEDEDAVREVVTRILTRARYQVMPAASAKDALEIITNSAVRIDAMLTDVVMPGMPGPQLADRMRDARPQVPVVLMSGYTAGALPGGRAVPGDLPLVHKPFNAETLLQQLQDALT